MSNEKGQVTNQAIKLAKEFGKYDLLLSQVDMYINSLANKYLPKIKIFDNTVTFDDLKSDGVIGTIEALIKYDEGRGNFLTYARHYIILHIYYNKLNKKEISTDISTMEESSELSYEIDEKELRTTSNNYNSLISGLSEREQNIINMKCVQKLTFDEIGKRLNITGMRIHQIYNESLNKIRPMVKKNIESRYMLNNMLSTF